MYSMNITVSGGSIGISADNFGTGALTITANGNVTGITRSGIFALNYGAALSLTTGAGGITQISTTAITTSGLQNYNENVTLGANTTLTSTGGGATVANAGSIAGTGNIGVDLSAGGNILREPLLDSQVVACRRATTWL